MIAASRQSSGAFGCSISPGTNAWNPAPEKDRLYRLRRSCRGLARMPERSYANCVGRQRAAVLASVVIFGVATFAFAAIPQLQFAYYGVPLRVALETAASLIALVAGFLVYGRLRQCGRLRELLLASALATFALVNLCLLVVPALAWPRTNDLLMWVSLLGRTLGCALFAVAAFGPRRQVQRPGPALAVSVAVVGIVVLLIPAMLTAFAGGVAQRLAAALAPGSSAGPGLSGHLAPVPLQLATAAVYGAATIGFLRRYRRFNDEFLGWLAISGILAGLSHLNYSLYPPAQMQLVHAGDVFRLCCY